MPSSFLRQRRLVALFAAAVILLVGLSFWLAAPSETVPASGPVPSAPAARAGSGEGAAVAAAPRQPPVLAGSNSARSPEERRRALLSAALQSQGRAQQNLLAAALRDPDVGLRLEALVISARLAVEELDRTVLPLALQDEDPRLRDLAINRVNELAVSRRIEFFQGALHGANEEMAALAAQWLAVLGGKDSVNALVSAWSQAGGAPRGAAIRKALARLTGREFSGASEASTWWGKTAPGLDKDLQPLAP